MTVVDPPARAQKSGDGGDRKSRLWDALRTILNLLVVVGFGIAWLAGVGFLLQFFNVSAAENNGFFSPEGWAVLIALFAAPLIGYSVCSRMYWQYLSNHLKRFPVWPQTGAMLAGGIVSVALAFALHSLPVTRYVAQGEMRVGVDGTIYAPGTRVRGSRYEATSLRVPLTGIREAYPVRLPTGPNSWVDASVVASWTLAITPELRDYARAHPPNLTDARPSPYLSNLIPDYLQQEMLQLVRDEGQVGQTTVGEAGYWNGRSQASVPMSVRLGLRLEQNNVQPPSWLQSFSIHAVTVQDWNQDQVEREAAE